MTAPFDHLYTLLVPVPPSAGGPVDPVVYLWLPSTDEHRRAAREGIVAVRALVGLPPQMAVTPSHAWTCRHQNADGAPLWDLYEVSPLFEEPDLQFFGGDGRRVLRAPIPEFSLTRVGQRPDTTLNREDPRA